MTDTPDWRLDARYYKVPGSGHQPQGTCSCDPVGLLRTVLQLVRPESGHHRWLASDTASGARAALVGDDLRLHALAEERVLYAAADELRSRALYAEAQYVRAAIARLCAQHDELFAHFSHEALRAHARDEGRVFTDVTTLLRTVARKQ